MKKVFSFILLFFLFGFYSVCFSQRFEAGFYSGINYSDIHGQETGGKWLAKPGPAQGLNLGYSFNQVLGFQTGVNFSSVYYERKTNAVYWPIYFDYAPYYNYSSLRDPFYYSGSEQMDFRFVRVPLLLTINIPSEVQLRMRAGIFYTLLNDYNIPYYDNGAVKTDFGYLFSSGISYPITENFKLTFDVNYITGRKQFRESYNYRHGSTELAVGVAYNFSLKKKDENKVSSIRDDSSSHKATVTYFGGMNYSWNKGAKETDNFSGVFGPTVGFLINIPLGRDCFFQPGFIFERKGYSMSDSSASFYRTVETGYKMYQVESKMQIDYAILPALLSIPLGTSGKINVSTGPWLGLKLNARNVGKAYDESNTGSNFNYTETIIYNDMEKAIKGYDSGWIFGCGAHLPLTNDYRLDLSLQFSTGFRDVFSSEGTSDISGSYNEKHFIRNGTVSFTMGITIPSGNR